MFYLVQEFKTGHVREVIIKRRFFGGYTLTPCYKYDLRPDKTKRVFYDNLESLQDEWEIIREIDTRHEFVL